LWLCPKDILNIETDKEKKEKIKDRQTDRQTDGGKANNSEASAATNFLDYPLIKLEWRVDASS